MNNEGGGGVIFKELHVLHLINCFVYVLNYVEYDQVNIHPCIQPSIDFSH